MSPNSQDIASIIKRQIEEFGGDFSMVDIGTVVEADSPFPSDVTVIVTLT